jgi:gliding motility associated protien GldN
VVSLTGICYGQGPGGIFTPSNTYEITIKDCFKKQNYKGLIFKDSIKPNDIMRGQRIWRTIDLENRQNKAEFSGSGDCIHLGLFEIIKFGLLEKKLNAFSDDDFSRVDKTRLNQNDVIKQLIYKDSSETIIFDADGKETKSLIVQNRYLMNNDVKNYLIKEDWVVSAHSGNLEKKIVGLAPLIREPKTDQILPLFWIYYNEWKELFSAFEAKNFYSEERITYQDVFERRYFISRVSKENNIFDRNVKSYKHGEEGALEDIIIKEKIYNSERNLYQH